VNLPVLTLTAWWAAEAPADTGTDWISYLLNGGPFAIVLLLILLDKLGTHAERDRLRVENAALREQNQALNDSIRTEVVAPLTEQNRLMQEVVKILDDEDRFPRRPPPRRRAQ
jgi:hypothetical protein